MNDNTLMTDSLLLADLDYVPMKLLAKHMVDNDNFPYKSSFSFRPYIDGMNTSLCNACDFTQSALHMVLEQYQGYLKDVRIDEDENAADPRFQAMVSLVLPGMMLNDSLNFIAKPFHREVIVATEGFSKVYEGEHYEIKVLPQLLLRGEQKRRNEYITFILNEFYDQGITDHTRDTIVVRNKLTGIERYYDLRMGLEFVKAVPLKELPNLTQPEINALLNNIEDEQRWLDVFPKDMFEFTGFMVGSLVDVTEAEVTSELRQFLSVIDEDVDVIAFHDQLESYLKSYLNRADIVLGESVLDDRNFLRMKPVSLTKLTGLEMLAYYRDGLAKGGLYSTLLQEGRTVFCGDVNVLGTEHILEHKLLSCGIKSVILCPVVDSSGRVMNILEIGAHKEHSFNALTVRKLSDILAILNEGYLRLLDKLQSMINGIIKDQFTTIHPSVEWKFEETATEFFGKRMLGQEPDMPPIVFDNLYPLYGQADIVGSSLLRSEAIAHDAVANLRLLDELMSKWLTKRKIHILESYQLRINKLEQRLGVEFTATDETEVVNLISKEIHPLLHELKSRYADLSEKAYTAYFEKIDNVTGMVYDRRKQFEKSVGKLNGIMSSFMDRADKKMQKIQPHYFEKYKTDGVEYNLYLGKSLLKNEDFSEYDLKNFKIWQLTTGLEWMRKSLT